MSQNISSSQKGFLCSKFGNTFYEYRQGSNKDLPPIICLHMHPRSTDEFLELSSVFLAEGRSMVMIDEMGYGKSDILTKNMSFDDCADVVLSVADALGIQNFLVLGSMLGCFTSLSLSSRFKTRVCGLVLSMLVYKPTPTTTETTDTTTTTTTTSTSTTTSTTTTSTASTISTTSTASTASTTTTTTTTTTEKKTNGWNDVWTKRHFLNGNPDLHMRVSYDDIGFQIKKKATKFTQQSYTTYNVDAVAPKITCPVLIIYPTEGVKVLKKYGIEIKKYIPALKGLFQNVVMKDVEGGHLNYMNQKSDDIAQLIKENMSVK